MSNFQTRFDAAAPEAKRLVVENAPTIRQSIPNFFGRDFERLTKSISTMLERVDKNKVDHPEFLAISSGHVGEYAVQLMEGVPTSITSGIPHFLQTTLPAIVQCEERLVRAVGNYFFKVRDLKDRQVKEIQKLAEESVGFRHQAEREKKSISETLKKLNEELASVVQFRAQAEAAQRKVTEVRDLVAKLASGDARGKSLEALKRLAEDKIKTIDEILKNAKSASDLVIKTREEQVELAAELKNSEQQIGEAKTKADQVLGLSSQAGLASSYLLESRKLALKAYVFSGILYATSIAAAFIAAIYVLPELQDSLKSADDLTASRAIPLALLRVTILAPLVYIIYFTSKQVSSIEMIRMDYAEKAAASLAYSGYKGEMSEDGSLLERLRGSLLLKFAEHPERLLRKQPGVDTITVKAPGFEASSTSAEGARSRRDKEVDVEEDE